MRALFVTAEGYTGPAPTLELLTHNGLAHLTQGEDGQPEVRLQLGYHDAGSLLRWLRQVFPNAEANVVGCRCETCGALATVNVYVLGAERHKHWCEDHVPDDKRERERPDYIARPAEATATLQGVAYYLRSAFGWKQDEIADMLRDHPYTIAAAAQRGMTVEAVAVDINRRATRPSARLQVEQLAAEAGNPIQGEAPR